MKKKNFLSISYSFFQFSVFVLIIYLHYLYMYLLIDCVLDDNIYDFIKTNIEHRYYYFTFFAEKEKVNFVLHNRV